MQALSLLAGTGIAKDKITPIFFDISHIYLHHSITFLIYFTSYMLTLFFLVRQIKSRAQFARSLGFRKHKQNPSELLSKIALA